MTNVHIGSIADKLAGANLTECHTRTVIGINIGCDLKDESGEFLVRRDSLHALLPVRDEDWELSPRNSSAALAHRSCSTLIRRIQVHSLLRDRIPNQIRDKHLRSVPDHHAACLPMACQSADPVLPYEYRLPLFPLPSVWMAGTSPVSVRRCCILL